MLKNKKIKILLTAIGIIIIGGYISFNSSIGNQTFRDLKSFLTVEQKEFIKKYIFPYTLISQQEQTISEINLITF